MKLYSIQHDGSTDFVEAASMPEAIVIWRAWVRNEDPDGWKDEPPTEPEPDGCTLMSESAVIRGGTP